MAQRKLTAREKELRAKYKKKLQGEGILPPDKPRLNRKKFIEEALAEWNGRNPGYVDGLYLKEALGIMTGALERKGRSPSLEAVGAAKVLKLAIRLRQFSEMVKERGDTEYKVSEMVDYIRDILDA